MEKPSLKDPTGEESDVLNMITANNVEVPDKCQIQISDYPKLDSKQVGHLRHFYNLVAQPDGEWRHFSTAEYHQEFDDAIRYQLASMSYAAGAAHYHRLPALKGAFKSLIRRLIQKMFRREVWGYWFNSSHGGRVFNPDLKELRKPWADPVVKENIMYSGHLLLMTSLYAMLFDDDEFEKENSIVFKWDPLFWGLGKQDFYYDNRSLQKVILEQMEENGWVGVCCEPNAVFVVCNQFPIVAMRYNDSRDKTHILDDVLVKYRGALESKGMFGADGLYASYWAVQQKKAVPAFHGAHTAWANAFMNAWAPGVVSSLVDKQTLGFLTHFNGGTQLQATQIAGGFRKLVLTEGKDPNSLETLQLAREQRDTFVNPKVPFETLSWGCFTMMLSELGREKELDDLLEYADTKLNPTWENGGLYYPRNDDLFDEEYNLVHVEPHSGNAMIGYARLNVKDGQRKMWEHPWTAELLTKRPFVDGAGFADDVDFLRGIWDEQKEAMIITAKSWQAPAAEAKHLTFQIKNLSEGRWAIYVDGSLKDTADLMQVGQVDVKLELGAEEVDIVVVKV